MRPAILRLPGRGSRREREGSCRRLQASLKLAREESSVKIPCKKSSNKSCIPFCIKNLQNHNAFPPLKLNVK